MPRTALLVSTHALCLIGGGVFLYQIPAAKDLGKDAAVPVEAAVREAADPMVAEGEKLASQAMLRARGSTSATAGRYDPAEALRLAGQMAPGEGERQLRALTGDGTLAIPPGTEAAAAYLSWFREDPPDAVRLFRAVYLVPKELLAQALEQIPLEQHLALGKEFFPFFRGSARLYQTLAPRLAALDTKQAAAFIQANFSIGKPGDPIREVVRAWPAEDFDGLVDLAIAAEDPVLAMLVLDDEKDQAKANRLFRLLKSRDYLPALYAKYRDAERALHQRLYLHAGPAMPLEERIAESEFPWRGKQPPPGHREETLGMIATCDVHYLMESGGPDLRHAFRHGVMRAIEVLGAVETALPELTAAAAKEVRLNVFRELAVENPGAAYGLLSGLTEQERKLAVLEYSTSDFIERNPAEFLAILNLAPEPDSPEEAKARKAAWDEFSKAAYRNLPDDYIGWVRQLPAGPNRTAARLSLGERIKYGPHMIHAEEFLKP